MHVLKRLSVMVFLISGFISGVCFAKVVDKTVAMVNTEAVMLTEFEKIMTPVLEQYKAMTPPAEQTADKVNELKKKILDQVIDEKLLKQEAEKRNIRVSKRDIDDGIEQVRKRFPSEAEFQKELKKENISIADFEKRIKEQLMVLKMTETEVKGSVEKPTENDVKDIFEKIKLKMEGKNLGLPKDDEDEIGKLSKFFSKVTAEQVRARHILVVIDKEASMKDQSAALAKIKDLKKKIDGGADFAKVAEQNSNDPVSAKQGGDLGYFAKGDMVPELEKAAFDMKVGQVSAPIRTEFGYHLLKVEEHKAGRTLAIEDVKEDLMQYVYQKAAQKKYESWLKSLRASAKIKVYDIE